MIKLISRLIWKFEFLFTQGFWPGPEQDRMAEYLNKIEERFKLND